MQTENPAISLDQDLAEDLLYLEKRLGKTHAKLRLGIEVASDPRVFGGGLNFFHPENWYSTHALIRYCLKLSGLYWRGVKNAANFKLNHNTFKIPHLPQGLQDFTLLHLSDLHVDMNFETTRELARRIASLQYDICVLTGDYRANTFGSIKGAMDGMKIIMESINAPVYGVLGNHDSIRMVPQLEKMGIHMLLNETVAIDRNDSRFYLAGIDDAHYFRVDNMEKTLKEIPEGDVSLLLSHTPEIFRQAAHADFNIMLCGHTHGGQICLPGGIPITLDAKCPRYVGKGDWRYKNLQGYTSVGAGTSIVNVRLNCRPEITLHTFSR
ncbi:MAG: metallophosphoesterase [Gammaproteobacteria bacterium]|nr:metallophosphoesterase [Gammaproteobacteria bacterium]MDH5800994.1 metallophosphoesterase [Gammaproteobacteria bacterium]